VKTGVIVSAALVMILVPSIAHSEQILWDLQIRASLENALLQAGEVPAVVGNVADHAGDPVQGSAISVMSGILVSHTVTDENGDFVLELTGFDGLPGIYAVQIRAESGEKIGMASLQFQVRGEVRESQVLLRQLESSTAQKYIHADEQDYANDPIGMQLYWHYQQVYRDYLAALELESRQDEEARRLDERREQIAQQLQEEIEEEDPGAGRYEGWAYERFVDNLDRSVKDTIVRQLNYTTTALDEAQELMESILEGGGTYQEAREAYFDRMVITREMMERITQGAAAGDESPAEPEAPAVQGVSEDQAGGDGTGTADPAEVAEPETMPEDQAGGDGTGITVDRAEDSIFISINGTVIEFLVNGTQIIHVTNQTQD